MRSQIHYIDSQLDRMQESMKELHVIPETTPNGEGMTRNHSLALKHLWVNETELVPIEQIQIVNDKDTEHTTSKLSSHPIPNRQKPDESNGQIRIPQDPSCNEYWIPDIDQECRQTELHVIPETTPNGEGMTRNHSLALKHLWVNETELVPIEQIQIVNDKDTEHTTSKLSSHPIPNRQKPDESNGQIRIPQDPSCNEYWIPDIDQECRQTTGIFNQTGIDALHCRQLQNKE